MWENIYTKQTISDQEYSRLFSAEKRNWRRVYKSNQPSSISETTTPSTSTWIDIGDTWSSNDNNWSNNDNNWSNDNSSNSTDFGGGDFGGGGSGGDW